MIKDDDALIAATDITLGGRDKDAFVVDKNSGEVKFKPNTTPDYETTNSDHSYQFSLTVDFDGQHQITYSKLIIPILNINEGQAILSIELPTDGQIVADATLTARLSGDPDGDANSEHITWQWQWLDGQVWTDLAGNGANSAAYILQTTDAGRGMISSPGQTAQAAFISI